jgi:hypothetical protein
MNTLAEIENATETLSATEKQELLLFLATRLRGERQKMPPARRFGPEQMGTWMAEDEADLKRLRPAP